MWDLAPRDAARTLEISLPRYYLLEQRALSGLLAACEARTKGPGRSVEREIARLERELASSQRECARQSRRAGISACGAAGRRAGRATSGESGGQERRQENAAAARAAADAASSSAGLPQPLCPHGAPVGSVLEQAGEPVAAPGVSPLDEAMHKLAQVRQPAGTQSRDEHSDRKGGEA